MNGGRMHLRHSFSETTKPLKVRRGLKVSVTMGHSELRARVQSEDKKYDESCLAFFPEP